MLKSRAWLYPNTTERDYMRLLLSYVRTMDKSTKDKLKELDLLRNDAVGDWSEAVTAAFLELLASFLNIGETVIARLPDTFTSVSKFNDQQWRLQVKAGTGIEIGPSGALPFNARAMGSVVNPNQFRAVFGVGVDVYRSEPWLSRLQQNWVAQNVNLIKSIPEQYLTRVETIVRQGVMQGASVKSISDELQKIEGVTENRARLIARDQIGKANAALSEERMSELGIDEYIWTTSHDERVRPTHQASDGNTYSFKKGSPHCNGANPGQEVMCRCWAKPKFKDD